MRNEAQTKCKRCRRWHLDCINSRCIPDEQWAELKTYAANNGRTWKSRLRWAWTGGSADLRWARNLLGPSGLDAVDLDARRYQRRRTA